MKFIKELPRHEINDDIIELVNKLRANGYKTGILSNNTMKAAGEIRSKLFGHFDTIIVSAEIGVSKPNAEAFEIFTERLGVLPGELIFVDDTQRNLSAAEKIDFLPILFTDYKSLLQNLISLGIRID